MEQKSSGGAKEEETKYRKLATTRKKERQAQNNTALCATDLHGFFGEDTFVEHHMYLQRRINVKSTCMAIATAFVPGRGRGEVLSNIAAAVQDGKVKSLNPCLDSLSACVKYWQPGQCSTRKATKSAAQKGEEQLHDNNRPRSWLPVLRTSSRLTLPPGDEQVDKGTSSTHHSPHHGA